VQPEASDQPNVSDAEGGAPAPAHARSGEADAIPFTGLTTAEAGRRRTAGQGNDAQIRTGRTYWQIVRENVFNFINNLFYVMGALLLILGKPLDAIVVVSVITANTVISLIQEIRAKRVMDRIAILMRPKATVVRDGELRDLDPSQVVLGDVLYVHPGDQIVVDGPVLGPGRMEVDESLLTGESDLVPKEPGEHLMSGSFCVTGGGYYEAQQVGLASFANKLMAKATTFVRELTPLQRQISKIVRVLLLVVVVFEILVWIRNIVGGIPFVESVRMSTVILALIPNGLILSIALTYALGAVRLLGQNILVQRFNAIESLSNVDVLCTDKTGTLTSGVIKLEDLLPLEASREQVERILAAYAASTSDANKTIAAVQEQLPGERRAVTGEALFSSARKWSGLVFAGDDDHQLRGTYVFGAPEMIAPALAADAPDWSTQADAWAGRGLRVLLLAGRPEPAPFAEREGQPELPQGLKPLGLVSFSDELRDGVRTTLDEFTGAGIEVKIISGDNAKTVSALAMQAGVHPGRADGHEPSAEDVSSAVVAISGPELAALSPDELAVAAEKATIFGRVTPEQKEDLVRGLRRRGRYVAMIGDGVNDVIALKQANVAVGMQGGSQAARGVSDLILLHDTFAPLPFAFREGQRIINGMNDILHIFMVRIVFKATVIAAITALGGFPYAPRQASLVSFVSVGAPAFAFAIWARSGPTPKVGLFKLLARFVLPTAFLLLLGAVIVWLAFAIPAKEAYLAANPAASETDILEHAYPVAQTAITLFSCFGSIILILFAVPPTKWFAGGARLRGDWRIAGVAVLLFAWMALVLTVPFVRYLFELQQLPVWQYAAIFAGSCLWAVLVHLVWQSGMLDGWLGTVDDPGNVRAKAQKAAPTPQAEAAAEYVRREVTRLRDRLPQTKGRARGGEKDEGRDTDAGSATDAGAGSATDAGAGSATDAGAGSATDDGVSD
jgi:cation-transporting ATPase E